MAREWSKEQCSEREWSAMRMFRCHHGSRACRLCHRRRVISPLSSPRGVRLRTGIHRRRLIFLPAQSRGMPAYVRRVNGEPRGCRSCPAGASALACNRLALRACRKNILTAQWRGCILTSSAIRDSNRYVCRLARHCLQQNSLEHGVCLRLCRGSLEEEFGKSSERGVWE